MRKVEVGMSEQDVVALLGKPDDVRTQHDAGGMSWTGIREIWRYGTDGHLTCPTLGAVWIDRQGKVRFAVGGHAEPPDPAMLPEADLRRLLRLMDAAPNFYSSYHFDPRSLIRVVNALQPLGKEKALAALTEYVRVTRHGERGREGVILALRVLFDVPADPGYAPKVYGGCWSDELDKKSPRYPIFLHDDVPLLLVMGYTIGGGIEDPETFLEYYRKHGQIRKQPLVPTNDPLALWKASQEHDRQLGAQVDRHDRFLVANQILNMIDSVYRIEPNVHDVKFWPDGDGAKEWAAIQDAVAPLDVRWDKGKERYVFPDGSFLPDLIRKLYRREIWPLDDMNGEAELTLERTDAKRVSATLRWSGKVNPGKPTFDLALFDVNVKDLSLVKWKSESNPVNGKGGTYESWESFQFVLPENARIQARLVVGERERLSPIYSP